MESDRDLIYGVFAFEKTLMFIPRAEAMVLANIWSAIETAKTWKDFREKMPADIYEKHMAGLFDDADEPRPSDGEAFDYDAISLDYEWPENPFYRMEKFLPPSVRALGSRVAYRGYFSIDSKHEAEAVRILLLDGWSVERDDLLAEKACGNWADPNL